jgi:sensor histidine kinase regulating citrate/malate metabolism
MKFNLLTLVEQSFSSNLQDLYKARQFITTLLFVIDNPDNTLVEDKRAEIEAFLQDKPKTLQIEVEKGQI